MASQTRQDINFQGIFKKLGATLLGPIYYAKHLLGIHDNLLKQLHVKMSYRIRHFDMQLLQYVIKIEMSQHFQGNFKRKYNA